MSPSPSNYSTASTLRKELDITAGTLRNWALAGTLDFVQLPGGKRLYRTAQVFELVGKTPSQEVPPPRTGVVYARVSSAHQKGDLERQAEYLKGLYPDHELIQDIGSGLNWSRRGLLRILDQAYGGHISEVVVAYKDRLCRFGFELLEWIFKKHNVQIVVLNTLYNPEIGPETGPEFNELADDLLAVTTYFVAKNNGTRSAQARRKRQQLRNSRHAQHPVKTDSSTEEDTESLDGIIPILLQQSGANVSRKSQDSVNQAIEGRDNKRKRPGKKRMGLGEGHTL